MGLSAPAAQPAWWFLTPGQWPVAGWYLEGYWKTLTAFGDLPPGDRSLLKSGCLLLFGGTDCSPALTKAVDFLEDRCCFAHSSPALMASAMAFFSWNTVGMHDSEALNLPCIGLIVTLLEICVLCEEKNTSKNKQQ